MKTSRNLIFFAKALFLALSVGAVCADSAANDPMLFGFKIRIGGRYDNVRKCVASKTGTKGGIAADISAFAEFPTGSGALVHIDLPVMRPILFAAAFRMLQFEPTVALKFSDKSNNKIGWVAGPAFGVSLHYGPDYNSEASGSGRTPSFFAMGPIVGAYAGLDFRRPGETFNFQLGLSPYITPLFGIGDPENHRGVVIGGLIDGTFRFSRGK
ncbi:MAG: hypothetical protein JW913_20040 [Chitinispirillaceae bacterium]|nr:hypothetical protein [Chitinispirillaceae bacterium]